MRSLLFLSYVLPTYCDCLAYFIVSNPKSAGLSRFINHAMLPFIIKRMANIKLLL